MEDVERIKNAIGTFPDFPIPGIMFRDVFPLVKDPELLELVTAHFVNHIKEKGAKVDVIVGLDARGFLFGPLISMRLGAAFVPVRKAGKLPGKVQSVEFQLEYGKDVFEMQEGSILPGQNVIIVDDLLATGGTMKAASQLVEKMGGKLLETLCVIELADLNARKVLTAPHYSIVSYD